MVQVRRYNSLQEMVGVGKMSKIIHTFQTQYELVSLLSKSIAMKLETAIRTKGKANLIVSGGSTPLALFRELREISLEWEKVNIGLCDERWISPSHEESNENLVKNHLLQGKASRARFIGMYNEYLDIYSAEKCCTQKIKETLFPFDVVVLGMGNDGHTASLFPNNTELKKAFDLNNKELCIAIEPKTASYKRMSLTLSAILSAQHIYLHFEGKEKTAVYKTANRGKNIYTMPIRAVLNQDIRDLEVYYT
ncbi:MAG: 6-phosphogluconolactonase (EC, eukaryotic type [uncultured Sulfurovum sp.]|uniref:6-phosphogluconolactonase n=1 Tax=uncultured Sulfurovum sp. TaxID=269237 RepID=A0A6S6TVN4_9BACT|nr:MAG: 6-phosphogluconolactonase (EC, eukaryotic type [uncultured Sulfurovum sp.]